MNKLVIFLDAAHGEDVEGKQSPCGNHHEYKWSRYLISKLKPRLESEGFKVILTNNTILEIGLTNRVNIVQNYKVNEDEVKYLLSLHNNASGLTSEWRNPRGVEIFTSPHQSKSDTFADIIMGQLENDFPELRYRKDTTDGDSDKEARFTILMGNGYYANLLEWLFQDNQEDFALLKDEDTNNKLVDSLTVALINCNNTLK